MNLHLHRACATCFALFICLSPLRGEAGTNETIPATLKEKNFFGKADTSRSLSELASADRPYGGLHTWDDYRALLTELSKPRYLVLPLRDCVNDKTSNRVVIAMRHDSDSHVEKAPMMAAIEKEFGIRSTYFFLHTAKYYGELSNGVLIRNAAFDQVAKEIALDGFEVGIHSDLFTVMYDFQFDPTNFIKEEIVYYRDLGVNVVGAAAHGSAEVIAAGLNNMWMFSEFGKSGKVVRKGREYGYGGRSLADYDLRYEGYLLRRDVSTGDIDARLKGKPASDLIAYLSSLTPGTRVAMLTHPEHWGKKKSD